MNRFFLLTLSLFFPLSMMGQLPFQKTDVKDVMKKVADWQLAHQKDVKHGALDWTNAALYMGMLDWAELAETEMGDASYYDWLVNWVVVMAGSPINECIMLMILLWDRFL